MAGVYQGLAKRLENHKLQGVKFIVQDALSVSIWMYYEHVKFLVRIATRIFNFYLD